MSAEYSKINYDKNGYITGEVCQYYPTGEIKQVYNFRKEIPHGLHTGYYQNGNRMGQCVYDMGNRDGRYTEWYENGQLKYTVNYMNDTEVGEGIRWNEDGTIKYVINFDMHTMTSYEDEKPRTRPYHCATWRERNENSKKYPRPKNIPA